jgi:ribonuclease Z
MTITWKMTFLGTAASAVSKQRNPTSMLLTVEGKHLLVECAEGATRRLVELGIDMRDIDAVYLSHGHNDHMSGIVTFLWQNVLVAKRATPLYIIAPGYVIENIKKIIDLTGTPKGFFPFDLVFEPVDEQHLDTARAIPLSTTSARLTRRHALSVHDPPAIAIRMDIASKSGTSVASICYPGDTSPTDAVAALATGCDFLIHEATLLDEEEVKAKLYNHSTPSGAARIAAKARAKNLVIIHYSVFLEGKESMIAAEARKQCPCNVIVANDLMEIPEKK